MTYDAWLHFHGGLDLAAVRVNRFADIEYCERLRDVEEKSIICKKATRTYASPEPEDELMWIRRWSG